MSKNVSKQNMRHTGRNVWLVVLILFISIMLTLALLGTVLSKLTKNESSIIPLLYDGVDIHDKNGFSYTGSLYDPEMRTYDSKQQWGTSTSVDLFKAAYANNSGSITVQSGDGENIIAPGTSDEYVFYLKNTGNVTLDYKMILESAFTLDDYSLPILVRLSSGDRWILGDEETWVGPDSIAEITDAGTVDVNEYVTYTFEWQWPFEIPGYNGYEFNDHYDTALGNISARRDVSFSLSIETLSTAAAVSGDITRDDYVEPLPLRDAFSWLPWLALLLALLALILLLLLLRTPIYVTGFIPAAEGSKFNLDKKETELLPGGRFVFKKVYMGKRRFVIDEKECRIRLKRKSKIEGIVFEEDDDMLKVFVSREVRAVELYLLTLESEIVIRQDKWAAIDKKRNVITPEGVTEPEDKENTTPGGLHVDKDGYFEILEVDSHVPAAKL